MTRRLALVAAAAGLLVVARPGTADAICPVTAVCASAAPLISACCGATTCTLDGPITITGPACELDFGARDVTLSGALNVGSNTLMIRAGGFHVTGTLTATGSPGGNVTVMHSAGGRLDSFTLEGHGKIDVSGSGSGGGKFRVDADGRVSLEGTLGSSVVANGSGADSTAGTIAITSSEGEIGIGVPVLAVGDAQGAGGSVTIDAGTRLSFTPQGVVAVDGGTGDAGFIELDANGPITLPNGSTIQGDGLGSSEGSGGEINITGGSINAQGVIEVRGGSSASGTVGGAGGNGGQITIDATSGALAVTRGGGVGLSADGALGGDAGDITLMADSPTQGAVTIGAQISAQGFGTTNRPASGGSVDLSAGSTLTVTKLINVGAPAGDSGTIDLSTDRGDVVLNAPLNGIAPTGGGTLTVVSAHDVQLNADVLMRSTANQAGSGGDISVSADNDVLIPAASVTLDASGALDQMGGDIELSAGRNVTVGARSSLKVNSGSVTGAAGGTIRLTAGDSAQTGTLTVDGQLDANGSSTATTTGASITLEGCQVRITGVIDSSGDAASANHVSARATEKHCSNDPTKTCTSASNCGAGSSCDAPISVKGKLRSTGSNTAVLPVGAPSPSGTGPVTPAFAPCPCASGPPSADCCMELPCTGSGDVSGCLMPCPQCGDHVQQFPETCDPAPGLDRCTGGCNQHCRLENCDDRNGCTSDTCDLVFGCANEPVPDGTPCPDGDLCNGSETCLSGACRPGIPPDCDDHNPCTNDCDPAQGCVHTLVPDGPSPECNGNVCNGEAACKSGVCAPGTPVNCDDGNPDTNDSCDPATGNCRHVVPSACTNDLDCDDHNPCTADTCDAVGGGHVCHNRPVAGTGIAGCDDGDACNGAETCVNGICQPGTPLSCPADDQFCTDDRCRGDRSPAEACVHEPIAGCCETVTPGDIASTEPVCDDGNPCTLDQCAADHTCTHAIIAGCCLVDADCDDGNPCTSDACKQGTCTHDPDPAHEGQNCGPDACTVGAVCTSGSCSPGEPLDCPPDPDLCVNVFCDPVDGCVRQVQPNCCHSDLECDDHNACTRDTCDGMVCDHAATDTRCQPCTSDANCASAPPSQCQAPEKCRNGVCVDVCHACTSDTECAPIVLGVGGQCAGKACRGGACVTVPQPCDDGNPNTGDKCVLDANEQPQCSHTCLNNKACDDGNACNGTETCVAGACRPGTALGCDDGDICTDDSCNPTTGCVHVTQSGFDGIAAQLSAVEGAVSAAASADLSPSLAKVVRAKTSAMRTKLGAAHAAAASSVKREGRMLKAANKALSGLTNAIRNGQKARKPKISSSLATTLLGRLGCTGTAVQSLQAELSH